MAATQYDMHEAKTQLSRIIERVEHGEEVVISRAGRPVAKVISLPSVVERRGRGALKGQIVAAVDWDAPETNQELARDLGPPPPHPTRPPGRAVVTSSVPKDR